MTDEPHLLAMLTLLALQQQALACREPVELAFFAVNELHRLCPYRQAVLWQRDGRIAAVSGLPGVEDQSPFILWLTQALTTLPQLLEAGPPSRTLTLDDLPPAMGEPWSTFLPAFGLCLPLYDREGGLDAVILLVRDLPWREEDRLLLEALARVVAAVRVMLQPRPNFWQRWRQKRLSPGWLFWLPVAAAWLPVPLSVLAPAEIVAESPAMVRSPLDGVVNTFQVMPNQRVTAGQVLFELDDTTLRNRLTMAQKERDVLLAQFRQGAQRAVRDDQATARQEILRERWQQHQSEVEFLENQLQRVIVKSPRDGIAIFADPYDWIGRPLKLGERVITLADPGRVEVEIRLPVADAVALQEGAEVALFLDQNPDQPLHATVRYAGYQAEITPAGFAAYTLRASLSQPAAEARIGMQGTARIVYGQGPLYRHLLRRPITVLRQWLGV